MKVGRRRRRRDGNIAAVVVGTTGDAAATSDEATEVMALERKTRELIIRRCAAIAGATATRGTDEPGD
jgi:hypothetical protein